MDFYSSKENIMPLAGGRDIRFLETALSAESHQELMLELQKQRRQYEESIQNYDGKDPLEPWFEYILWIEQSYPSGGKENGLEQVLLKCLATFENNQQYYQDRRLVKLYIKYIDTQPNPQEFYQELYNQGIGTMVAELYICWAYYYDLCGNFSKADSIFRMGLDAKAQPYDDLDQAHKHFGFTMSQRILHQDEESHQQFINSMQERRHALTSLRTHKKKVGSIRTGSAVKAFNPGKIQVDRTKAGSSNQVVVSVFEDQNHDPNEMPPETSQSQSVVRSIIDSNRKQENMKEPGPWSKAKLHTKRKGGLFDSSKSSGHELGFAILEDNEEQLPPLKGDDNVRKGIQLPPNHVSRNIPQPIWEVPLTLELQVAANVYPCYDKFMLYPKPGYVYSPEEFVGYNWFKKRNIENKFTKAHDNIWSDTSFGFRKYPNFSSKNEPQTEFQVDKILHDDTELPTNVQFACILNEIYPKDMTVEFQFEEILARKWRRGERKLKFDTNDTIIVAEEMDETGCVYDPNGRRSIYPSRKSMGPPSAIPRPSTIAAEAHKSRRSVIISNASMLCPVAEASLETSCPEEVVGSESNKFEIYEDREEPAVFKTPNIPTKVRPAPVFEPEDEEGETASGGYAANETCSTQTFNFYIKAQSVSTPKRIRQSYGHLQQVQEIAVEPQFISPPTPPIDTDQQTNATNTTNFPPKQLSVIMETTETHTGSSACTKSSVDTQVSSPDNDTEISKSQHVTMKANTEQTILQTIPECTSINKTNFGNTSAIDQQKDDVMPSMIMSMKLFEEKTETIPKILIKPNPQPSLTVNADEFYNLFVKTPEKNPPPTNTLRTDNFVLNDSLTFSKLKDFTMSKFGGGDDTKLCKSMKDLNSPEKNQSVLPLPNKSLLNTSVVPGFESFEFRPKLLTEDELELNKFNIFATELNRSKSPMHLEEPRNSSASFHHRRDSFEDNAKSVAFHSNQSTKRSIHIKEEPLFSITTPKKDTSKEKSILSRFSEISKRQSKASTLHKTSSSRNRKSFLDPDIVFLSNSGNSFPKPKLENVKQEKPDIPEVVFDELGVSIYDMPPPKSPNIQRHNWDEQDDNLEEYYDDSGQNKFVHQEVDLNYTRQVIDEHLIDQNLNPFDLGLIKAFLEQIDFCNYLEQLSSCSMINKIQPLKKGVTVKIADKQFDVIKLIGEGSYGSIFSAKDPCGGKVYALKQQKPAHLWEYYICLELRSRINNVNILRGLMDVEYALIGNNASILVSVFSKYGSLINICHKVKQVTGKILDEYIVMMLSSQMLSIIDHLHACNIIHADIKPDNFLLMSRLTYGDSVPVVQLIDFGVAIDMALFRPKQKFTHVIKTEGFTCIEMLEKRPWTYQTDLFGIAGTIHVLLFGKYMEVEKRPMGWNIKTHMPRYFNKCLWSTIFSTLLNIRDCNSMPNLQNLRVELEEEIAGKERFVKDKINEFNLAIDN